MDPFDAMLGIVWTVVVIGIAIIVIIYAWAKRYPRWKDSPWWITLIFAIGMAKIVGAIGAILVFGVPKYSNRGSILDKRFPDWRNLRRLCLDYQQPSKGKEANFKLTHYPLSS